MGRTCCVPGCSSSDTNRLQDVRLHVFPKDLAKRELWYFRLRHVEGLREKKIPCICSRHFFPQLVDGSRLRNEAVPALFIRDNARRHDPDALVPANGAQRDDPASLLGRTPPNVRLQERSASTPPDVLRGSVEHTYAKDGITPVRCKRKIEVLEGKVEDLGKRVKAQAGKIKRLSTKLLSKEDIIQELSKDLEEAPMNIIKGNFAPGIEALLARKVMNKKGEYSDEVKQFAVLVHLASPRCYDLLRSESLPLPAPSTIRVWSRKYNFDPGYIDVVLKQLKVESEKGPHEVYAVLVFDEMHLMTSPKWDGSENVGRVDFGQGVSADADETNTDVATHAMVAMTVGINRAFRVPFYLAFLIGMYAKMRKCLILESICQLKEVGVRTRAVVCDALNANINAYKLLGLNHDALLAGDTRACSVSFPDPTHVGSGEAPRIFMYLDACHMLKLLRNVLGDLDIFWPSFKPSYPSDCVIQWKYIEMLHKKQSEEGLRLANKLSQKVLDYKKNKMSMSMAAKIFSQSVAHALTFMTNKYPREFDKAHCLIEFLRRIDVCFDLLNSRSPYAHWPKKALTGGNEERWSTMFAVTRSMLLDLEINQNDERVKLVRSRRHAPALGFIMDTLSSEHLFRQLRRETDGGIWYLRTFSTSQDPVEHLFSDIRARGGFNSNPTALQFKYRLKKCIMLRMRKFGEMRCLPAFGSNCNPFKNRERVEFETLPDGVKKAVEDFGDGFLEFWEGEDEEFVEHFMHLRSSEFTPLFVNSANYVAGYVVRCLLKNIRCDQCKAFLEVPRTEGDRLRGVIYDTYRHIPDVLGRHELIRMRDRGAGHLFLRSGDRGGLRYPSLGVFKLCIATDRILRCLHNGKPTRLKLEEIVACCLRSADPVQVFNSAGSSFTGHLMEDHPVDQNHGLSLCRAIVKKFLAVWIHHFNKEFILKLKGASIKRLNENRTKHGGF